MDDFLPIACPHCGESFPLAIDVSAGSTRFTTDCEICCRPMTIAVQVDEDGAVESVEVSEE